MIISVSLTFDFVRGTCLWKDNCIGSVHNKQGTMEKQLTCAICSQQYKENNVPRLLPKCGHSFCESCIKNSMKAVGDNIKVVCPEDKQEMLFDDRDINNFPKNIALIKLRENKKKDKSFNDCSLNESNIVRTCVNQADQEDKQLITAINESTKGTEGGPYNRSGSGLDLDLDDMCLIHQKPLEIVCIRDKTKICSTCAIFGDHKGHQFKSLDEVAKDKEKRCDEILILIDRKEAVEEKITGKQPKEELAKILKLKQEGLIKQIKERFAKISESIKLTEKKALDKVAKSFTCLQQKLKQDMKVPETVNKKYLRWQERAYHEIQSFDGQNNFIQQVKLLNYDRAIDQPDVIQEGEKIVAQIEKCVNSLVEYRTESVSGISVEFNAQAEKKISELVTVRQAKKNGPTSSMTITPMKELTTVKFKEVLESAKTSTHQRSMTHFQSQPTTLPLIQKFSGPDINQHSHSPEDQLLYYAHQDRPKEEQEPIVREIKQEPSRKSPEIISRPSISIMPMTPPSHQFFAASPQESSRKMIGTSLKDSSFAFEKAPSKKRPKIKLPQKYQKILDGIINDQLETVDFTNAQLGDQTMIQITECLKGKKVKTLKLIRNKLTDEGLDKMLQNFSSIITLNLSQNLLTDKFIDRILDNLPKLPNLKSLILSQNKIKQRSVKGRLDEIKKYQIVVSL